MTCCSGDETYDSLGEVSPRYEIYDALGEASAGSWVMLSRNREYLPERACQRSDAEQADPVSWPRAYYYLLSGKFLETSDSSLKHIKKHSQDEAMNMGLISALFLTIFVPLLTENASDFMEESYNDAGTDIEASWFFSMLRDAGFANVEECDGSCFEAKFENVIFDVSLLLYGLPAWSLAMTTVGSLIVMLIYGQLKSDESVNTFRKMVGNPMRLVFLSCVAALLGGVGLFIRFACLVRSWWAAILITLVFAFFGFGLLHFVMVKSVKGLVTVSQDEGLFLPLSLSLEDVREDVALYLRHAGEEANLDGAIDAMCGVTPSGTIVELGGVSQTRVQVEWRKQFASLLGIDARELQK